MASSLSLIPSIPSTPITRRGQRSHCFSNALSPVLPVFSLHQTRRPLPDLRPAAPVSALLTEQEASPKENSKPPPSLPFRIGHGFDLHRLEPGYPLIIGGVKIPHERGCEAHSDGDVLLHCVVDAILGALGLPDIGQIFPDNDPKWKGAASSVFMKEASERWQRRRSSIAGGGVEWLLDERLRAHERGCTVARAWVCASRAEAHAGVR